MLETFLEVCRGLGFEVSTDEHYHVILGRSCEFSLYRIGDPVLSAVDVRATAHGVFEAGLLISVAQRLGLAIDEDAGPA